MDNVIEYKNKDSSCRCAISDENQMSNLADLYNEIILSIGEDSHREGLKHTANRAAKTLQFLTHGYHLNLEDLVKGALFDCDNEDLVVVKDIELFSLCEHHLLPIIGKCHIGYIPNGKVIGLSKLARIVDMYARRLQIQENLTKQIAQGVMEVTKAKGVAVIVDAMHLCMMARGVKKQHASTTTSSMLGLLKEDFKVKKEFLALLQNQE